MGHDQSGVNVGRLTELAARQHGAVSLAQLRKVVPSEWGRRRLIATGWIAPVAPGVVGVAGSSPSWEQQLTIGLLSLGPNAWVSHRAAAALHGFDRADPAAVEFLVARSERGRRAPFVVHSTGWLGRLDTVTVRGFAATSATRTIIDLARLRVPTAELEAAIDSAVRNGLSSPDVLDRRLQQLRGRGRWGCRRLDELLLDSGGHSRLERMFLRLVREAGLPCPRRQVVHRRDGRTLARVDFLFDPYDVVVEVSGRLGHTSPSEQTADAQRRNELEDLGRHVYEYTWLHLTREPTYVRRSLTDRLLRAGWPGPRAVPSPAAPLMSWSADP